MPAQTLPSNGCEMPSSREKQDTVRWSQQCRWVCLRAGLGQRSDYKSLRVGERRLWPALRISAKLLGLEALTSASPSPILLVP